MKKAILVFMFLFTISCVYGALTDDLFVYYKMDETSGTFVGDSMGLWNGTADDAGSVTASGKINYGRFSDEGVGGTGYVDLQDIGALPVNFSINAWIFPLQTSESVHRIVASRKSDGSAEYTLELNYDSEPKYLYFGIQTSGSGYRALRCNGTINANEWTMVTAVRNGMAMDCFINAVNGSNPSGGSGDSSGAITTGTDTHIGHNPTGSANWFNGTIDEVAIWKKFLTQAEITQLYNSGLGLQYPFTGGGVVLNNISMSLFSPANEYHTNNVTPLFQLNITNITGTWNVSLIINETDYGIQQFNTTGLKDFTANNNLGDAKLTWYFKAVDSTNASYIINSSFRNITIDTVNPVINWYNPLTDNKSVSKVNLTLNITGSDLNLWAWSYNVTSLAGAEICSGNNSAITGTSYNIYSQCNLTTSGRYDVYSCFADSHTDSIFTTADAVTKDTLTKTLAYDFKSDIIKLQLLDYKETDILDFSTTKIDDRYTFSYQLMAKTEPKTTYNLVYRLYSSLPIYQVKDSKYKGHVVIGDKYWFDLESKDVEVTFGDSGFNKTLNLYYQDYNVISTRLDITFNSLGGLNEVCEQKQYFFDINNPSFLGISNDGTGKKITETATFNTTVSDNYAIGSYLLETNNTGTWTNGTRYYGNFTSINDTITIQQPYPTEICGRFHIWDFVNNSNVTSNSCFNVSNSIPSNIFISQVPTDLNLTNFIGVAGVNMTYNISDPDGHLNLSSVRLFFKSNSTSSNIMYYQNGTAFSGYFNSAYTTNTSSKTFVWNLLDNAVLTGTYNFGEISLENTVHSLTTLNNANQYISIEMLNVTNLVYSFFELMANRSSGTGALSLYYCNSSYLHTNSPSVNGNCTLFGTVINDTYNHRHTIYSSHLVNSLPINNSKIGNVGISGKSYFILRGSTATVWNVYNIANLSRIGAMKTSTNGNTWTNQTYTVDAHLHQFGTNSSIFYYACANDTDGTGNCTDVKQDVFELGGLPPSAPAISVPADTSYKTLINITYTASASPNNYAILYYNISLYDSNHTFNKTIIGNNSNNLNYEWNLTTTADGRYKVYVTAYDALFQTATGISEEFAIDTIPPTITILNDSTANNSVIGVSYIFVNASLYDLNGIANATIFLYNSSGLMQRYDATGNITYINYNFSAFNLSNGFYYYNLSAYDVAGNGIYSVTNKVNLSLFPTVSSVYISPTTAYAGDVLTCISTYSGTFPVATLNYKWWRNSILQSNTLSTLTDQLNPSEQIICEVTPIDSLGNIGTAVVSSPLIISYRSGAGGAGGSPLLTVTGLPVAENISVNLTELEIAEKLATQQKKTQTMWLIIIGAIALMLIINYLFIKKPKNRRQ